MIKVDTTLSKGIVKMEPMKLERLDQSPSFVTKMAVAMGLDQDGPIGGVGYETFDLSLLGDTYDDHGLVPSPGSWMQASGTALDPAYWQQMSLYDRSPPLRDADVYLAYSPDTKPVHSPPLVKYESELTAALLGQATSGGTGSANRNLLLRQCLEDTTFQKKCDFKPLDIPLNRDSGFCADETTNAMPKLNFEPPSLEFNQIEPVFSLAFEQVRNDIQKTCATLNISPDPLTWSSIDVQSWLAHTLSSLPKVTTPSTWTPLEVVLANFWNLDGYTIHMFSEEDFVRCDPHNGDRLFANLELWKISAQMDAVKGDLENLLFGCEGQGLPQRYDELMLPPTLRITPEDSSSSIGYSDGSDTCSSVDSRSPRPNFNQTELMQTDDEDDDDHEDDEDKTVRPTPLAKKGGKNGGAHIHLWQFLKELLASPQSHGSCIRWLDQAHGVFKIEDSVRVARLWGLRKNRPAMNYDKLSRSIRQYYRKGIMRKTERSQRLVYQFCHPYGL